jgi:outer membrane murein-binding lipoprotein Lpp
MMRVKHVSRYLILGSFVAALAMGGCTKKPNEEELAKLEEARAAAESAERKLDELKRERMALESQVQAKEDELRNHEAERDDLKQKMGK